VANDPVTDRLRQIETTLSASVQRLDKSVTGNATRLQELQNDLRRLGPLITEDSKHREELQANLKNLGATVTSNATRLQQLQSDLNNLGKSTGDSGKRQKDLQDRVQILATSVADNAARLRELQNDLSGMRKELAAFIDEDRKTRAAEVALAQARARLDHEYGHYEAVRRIALGVLQALDADIVPSGALEEAAARLMLDAPGYWLPPAVAAVATWDCRQETTPTTARAAIRRAAGKSALFFSLIAAGSSDHAAAAHWIDEYLLSLDCRALPASFETVMGPVTRGDLGAPARDRLVAACAAWRDQLMKDDELARRQIGRWRAFIASQPPRPDGQLDLLPQVRNDLHWDETLGLLYANTVFHSMKDWLMERLRCEPAVAGNAASSIGSLLGDLVAAPDDREASLRELVEERQAALRISGHLVRPAASQNGISANRATRDFLTLLTDVAMDTPGGAPQAVVPSFAVTLSGDLIRRAVLGLSRDYVRGMPAAVDIVIEDWPRSVRQDEDPDMLILEFAAYTRREAEREVDRLRFPIQQRREDVRARWAKREQDGKEKIKRAVPDVHRFFAQWHNGTRAATECIGLIDRVSSGEGQDAG